MEVKCGKVSLADQHVMVSLHFRGDGTYVAKVALDNKEFAGIQDQAAEIFRAGMDVTVAWLQEWRGNQLNQGVKEEKVQ